MSFITVLLYLQHHFVKHAGWHRKQGEGTRPEWLTDAPWSRGCQAFLDKRLSDPCPGFRSDIQSATQPLAPQKPDHEPRCCPKRGCSCREAEFPPPTTKACHPGQEGKTPCSKDLQAEDAVCLALVRVVAFPGPSLKVRHAGPSYGHSQVSSGTSSSWASSGTLSSLQAEHLLLR